MKKFIIRSLRFLVIPVAILLVIYLIADPYRTLRPFSLEYFDETNRDYLSTELFLHNIGEEEYDSYIFGSSRAGGINTYHWLNFLPDSSRQFLFQGWSETLTGMEQKITYIDKHDYRLNNAIILIDIPGTFKIPQLTNDILSIKHPEFSSMPNWKFQSILFINFIQKPSQWKRAVLRWARHYQPSVTFDPISNDWNGQNKSQNTYVPPRKDSLNGCSELAKRVFIKEASSHNDSNLYSIGPLINDSFKNQLMHIKNIFSEHNTDYRIIITPAYCYSHPSIHPQDLETLYQMFGRDYVYDYSGKNELSSDYNNFSDPNHFGQFAGWHIIEDIYSNNR